MFGQLDRALAPFDGLRIVPVEHTDACLSGVSEAKLWSRRKLFEQIDRCLAYWLGLDISPRVDQQAGKVSQIFTFLQLVAELAPNEDCLVAIRYRRVQLTGDHALVGVRLKQRGAFLRFQACGEPESPRVLGGSLAVGAKRRRAF